MLHQTVVCFLRLRVPAFARMRLNAESRGWFWFCNLNLDFLLTFSPIFCSNALPNYNVQVYSALLLLIFSLWLVAAIDGKGPIVVNYLRTSNPKPTFGTFENRRVKDMFEKEAESSQEIVYFHFITNYRALIIIATCLSILAVDFPAAFPRRLCKTEEQGVSLVRLLLTLQMDIGVGAVMFSTGLTQRKVRQKAGVQVGSMAKELLTTIRNSFIVFIFGFVRFLVHREINYHVS